MALGSAGQSVGFESKSKSHVRDPAYTLLFISTNYHGGDWDLVEWNYHKQDVRGGESVEHGGRNCEEDPDAKEH